MALTIAAEINERNGKDAGCALKSWAPYGVET